MNNEGVDLKKIDECIGDPEADVENPILKAEQDAQVGNTIVISYLYPHLSLHLLYSNLLCLFCSFYNAASRLAMGLVEMLPFCQHL